MTEAAQEPTSAKEALAEALDAAYLADGYITTDGERDHGAVAAAIYPLVEAAFAATPAERIGKAVTRGTLFEAAFPSFPKREEWPTMPDPELVEAAYKLLWTKVWDLVKPDKAGIVQQLVGVRTPDRILCRWKVGPARETEAVYTTNHLGCLKDDFAGPLADNMRRANRRMSLNIAMAGGRLPEHAKAFDRLYRQANKEALTAGLNDTKLMLEAATDNEIDNGDNGDNGDVGGE